VVLPRHGRFAALVAATAALTLAPAAGAKFRLSLTVDNASPRVGQQIDAVLGADRALDYDLQLIAVAPGTSWYDVVGVVTGDSSRARARVPRDGFRIPVVRVAPNRWRALVRFPRPGRWRLVIPNGAAEGFIIPPPVVLVVTVG
jgi:hypothetical protein